jgi:Ca2+-binding EF-hand superfamily protein
MHEDSLCVNDDLVQILRTTLSNEMQQMRQLLVRNVKEDLQSFLIDDFRNTSTCRICHQRGEEWNGSWNVMGQHHECEASSLASESRSVSWIKAQERDQLFRGCSSVQAQNSQGETKIEAVRNSSALDSRLILANTAPHQKTSSHSRADGHPSPPPPWTHPNCLEVTDICGMVGVDSRPNLGNSSLSHPLPFVTRDDLLSPSPPVFPGEKSKSSEVSKRLVIDEVPSKLPRSGLTSEEDSDGERREGNRRSTIFSGGDKSGGISEIKALMHCDMEERMVAVADKRDIRSRFIYAVYAGYFDYLIGVFLCTSAIILGIETDVMTKIAESEKPPVFRFFDGFFFIVFTFELIIRLAIYKCFWFRMDGWQWNVFDLVVVISVALDEVSTLLIAGTDAHETIKTMGFVRLLKFGRIIRVIRMVRLIPQLQAMVYLIAASMSSFLWTMGLMSLMMYLLAVYYTEVAVQMKLEDEISEPALTEKWGSVGHSVYSLFQAVTGGDDWCNFVQTWEKSTASGQLKFTNTLIFVFYVSFAVLVMLNLVTGVFVEGAQRLIKQDRDAEVVKQARKLFALLGGDGDHEITYEDFCSHLDSSMLDDYLTAVELRRDEAESLFEVLDGDGSGTLSLDEFLLGTLRMKGYAKTVDAGMLKFMVKKVLAEINRLQAATEKVQRTVTSIEEQVNICIAASYDLRRCLSVTPEVLV